MSYCTIYAQFWTNKKNNLQTTISIIYIIWKSTQKPSPKNSNCDLQKAQYEHNNLYVLYQNNKSLEDRKKIGKITISN